MPTLKYILFVSLLQDNIKNRRVGHLVKHFLLSLRRSHLLRRSHRPHPPSVSIQSNWLILKYISQQIIVLEQSLIVNLWNCILWSTNFNLVDQYLLSLYSKDNPVGQDKFYFWWEPVIVFLSLTLWLLVPSAEKFYKQFGSRSGSTQLL